MLRILQINLQNSREAQDILFKNMADWQVDLAVVEKPNNIPCSSVWSGDETSKAAIVLNAPVRNTSCIRVCNGK